MNQAWQEENEADVLLDLLLVFFLLLSMHRVLKI
jgi:hypothetical protein